MPARHDLLVGALDFLWRPWGSIEVWEDAITHLLRRDAGVTTMLVTDHPHLFEAGGENYHTDFRRGTTCAATRTTRGGPAPTRRGSARRRCRRAAAPSGAATTLSRTLVPRRGRLPRAADDGRGRALARPGARRRARPTSASCCSSTSSTRTSRSTRPSRGPAVRPGLGGRRASSGRRTRWTHGRGGPDASATARHLRAQYGAKLSMIDHWLGRILDVVDRHDAWDTTAFIALHRPRPLPRRAAASGASRRCPCTTRSVTSRCSSRGPASAPAHAATRSPRPSTCTPRSATCSASRREHRTHGHSLVPLLDGHGDARARLGAVRRLGPRGARGRRARARTRRRRSTRTARCRCGRTAGRRCRSRAFPDAPPAPPRPPGRARPHARAATCR